MSYGISICTQAPVRRGNLCLPAKPVTAGHGRCATPISRGGSRAAVIKGPANAWRPPITPVLTRR